MNFRLHTRQATILHFANSVIFIIYESFVLAFYGSWRHERTPCNAFSARSRALGREVPGRKDLPAANGASTAFTSSQSQTRYDMRIKAAVCRNGETPFSVETLTLESPRPDEVLVQIKACGICHTDLLLCAREGSEPTRPVVLGHEGAGIIKEAGKDIVGFKPGDAVLMSFDSCGRCPACLNAMPSYCDFFSRYNFQCARQDGTTSLRKGNEVIGSHFFGQSAFATHCLARQRNLVLLDKQAEIPWLAPLGCGIQAGAGAVMNALRIEPGQSIAVFGAGTVGLASVMAAKIMGATQIIAIDKENKRLRLARELGATHLLHSEKVQDLADAIRSLNGRGVDYSVDTTGLAKIVKEAVNCLDTRGCCALLASYSPEDPLKFDLDAVMLSGRTIIGSAGGDSLPQLFLPRLIRLFRQEKFPVNTLITHYPFEKINSAVQDLKNGRVVKAVLLM